MSGYIGSQPADSFLSISSQQITGNGGATYSLSSSVTSPEDIAVFVNNVRQNPNTYSVSNNQVTLGGTIASSDSCYVVFLGKTLATVNPPSGSVGNNQVSASLINSQTAESSANDSDEILIYDNSATALKKQTRANFLTGVGGANTPSWSVYSNATQNLTHQTDTLVEFQIEEIDTDNAFTNTASNYKFTCPSGKSGKYSVSSQAVSYYRTNHFVIKLYKNGSEFSSGTYNNFHSDFPDYSGSSLQAVVDLSENDYLQIYAKHDRGTGSTSQLRNDTSGVKAVRFQGFKLI